MCIIIFSLFNVLVNKDIIGGLLNFGDGVTTIMPTEALKTLAILTKCSMNILSQRYIGVLAYICYFYKLRLKYLTELLLYYYEGAK